MRKPIAKRIKTPPTDTPTPIPAFAPVDRLPFEELLSWKASPGNEDADLATGIEAEAVAVVGFKLSRAMRHKGRIENFVRV